MNTGSNWIVYHFGVFLFEIPNSKKWNKQRATNYFLNKAKTSHKDLFEETIIDDESFRPIDSVEIRKLNKSNCDIIIASFQERYKPKYKKKITQLSWVCNDYRVKISSLADGNRATDTFWGSSLLQIIKSELPTLVVEVEA